MPNLFGMVYSRFESILLVLFRGTLTQSSQSTKTRLGELPPEAGPYHVGLAHRNRTGCLRDGENNCTMARKRILIIDDEADIREIAQMSLEAVPDWEISTALSGKEGLEKARQEQPDAVLLDVMMPEMDGPATLLKFQENVEVSHIPVVMLTAKVQTSDRRRFLALGVKGVLPKPFDPISLPAELAQILGWEA